MKRATAITRQCFEQTVAVTTYGPAERTSKSFRQDRVAME
jgi:hypothetical protein